MNFKMKNSKEIEPLSQYTESSDTAVVPENRLAGTVGALLFSLAGGVVYFLLYQVGYIAAISGLIGVICAFKGYEVFAKKLSKFGCIISVVMALLVIILAWYCCLAKDVYSAYQSWFADGEIDFTLTFAESLRNAYRFLSEPEISKSYVTDLIIGIFLCALGAVRPIINIVKGNKNKAAENKNEPAFRLKNTTLRKKSQMRICLKVCVRQVPRSRRIKTAICNPRSI